ncbi:MAG: YgjP-like metallopeptidase domain-containing protein, partial [Stellaceae bacterium]
MSGGAAAIGQRAVVRPVGWDPGLGAPLAIRVSPRARRIGLRIDVAKRRVELVLPPGVPTEFGLRFLEQKRLWVTARLDALPCRVPFVEGAVVPVLGVPHRICGSLDPLAPPVAIGDGEIRVRGDPAHLARRVRDALATLARNELARRARKLAAQIGRKIAGIE